MRCEMRSLLMPQGYMQIIEPFKSKHNVCILNLQFKSIITDAVIGSVMLLFEEWHMKLLSKSVRLSRFKCSIFWTCLSLRIVDSPFSNWLLCHHLWIREREEIELMKVWGFCGCSCQVVVMMMFPLVSWETVESSRRNEGESFMGENWY